VRPSNKNANEASTKVEITKVEMDVGLAMFQVFELESLPDSEGESTTDDSIELQASEDGETSDAIQPSQS
jgi:hypothetical protein